MQDSKSTHKYYIFEIPNFFAHYELYLPLFLRNRLCIRKQNNFNIDVVK